MFRPVDLYALARRVPAASFFLSSFHRFRLPVYNARTMATDAASGFVIEGGKKLSGSVLTNRSKNGAVALLAASLLNKGTTTLHNVPRIEEVHRLVEVLESIGVKAVWSDHTLTLTPPEVIDLAR
jgi:UDP-N-acetylglucosamine 1-carboxyvinyltransferase